MNTVTRSWFVAKSSALFVASAVGSKDSLVLTAAGGVDGLGSVALVALFVPGSLLGTIAVLPQERAP